jgi:hypothetical protein
LSCLIDRFDQPATGPIARQQRKTSITRERQCVSVARVVVSSAEFTAHGTVPRFRPDRRHGFGRANPCHPP